jgi:hypothetical protein
MKPLVVSLAGSLAFFAIAARAVRHRQLREQSAVLWLAVGAVMIFFSATLPVHLINWLAKQVGVDYPPALLLILALVFLVLLVLHLSINLSRLNEKYTRLAQEFAIFTARKLDSRLSLTVDRTQTDENTFSS